MKRSLTLIALTGLVLAGCESTNQKEQWGTILGGATGAVVGSQFGKGKGQIAAAAAGTLLGAFIGSSVGRSLDRADMAYLGQTQQQTLETYPDNRAGAWQNPNSGNSGTITPTQTYQAASGAYCREFQQQITVGGKSEVAYGTACRQPDGSWKIQQ
ncbi:MAG: glycine zipper 2TM domain-containing protein [Proteobacteria bacterium]|nr:glycine zipper 2TM domain-containing protein [Pseudomonadota bacterium]